MTERMTTEELRAALGDNFWNRVDTSAGEGACWPWMGARYGKDRYGAVSVKLAGGRKICGTHRVAFLLSGGTLSDLKPHVLHSCDNKICCNPVHLSAGSHSENIRQACERGLFTPPKNIGDTHTWAIVTCEDVREIRRRLSLGETRKALAKEYGMSRSGIDHLASGRTWKHVT